MYPQPLTSKKTHFVLCQDGDEHCIKKHPQLRSNYMMTPFIMMCMVEGKEECLAGGKATVQERPLKLNQQGSINHGIFKLYFVLVA